MWTGVHEIADLENLYQTGRSVSKDWMRGDGGCARSSRVWSENDIGRVGDGLTLGVVEGDGDFDTNLE